MGYLQCCRTAVSLTIVHSTRLQKLNLKRVATGYGQPPTTFYDWTLGPSGAHEPSFRLSDDVYGRLLIETFSNKVTKALYSNRLDPVGLVSDNERWMHTTFLARDYEDLEQKLQLHGSCTCIFCDPNFRPLWPPFSCLQIASTLAPASKNSNTLAVSTVYLRAANLHLRLSAFFDSPSSNRYHIDLFALWRSTTSFLEAAFNVNTAAGNVLIYSTNYILQMIIAGGFSLLKLMNSFFASHVDIEYGRNLFNRTIQAIRSISVFPNDLPNRLAEVLAQLWRSSGAGSRRAVATNDSTDSSLQLKVKCRMSMSLVFDSVWRWREEFQAQGRGNLECMPILPFPVYKYSSIADKVPSRAQKPNQPRLRRRILRHLPRRQRSRPLSPGRRYPHPLGWLRWGIQLRGL